MHRFYKNGNRNEPNEKSEPHFDCHFYKNDAFNTLSSTGLLVLSTSLRFATFPKEQVIKKPHAILFVCPDRMTTRRVQGFFSEVANTLAESPPLGKGSTREGANLSIYLLPTDVMSHCNLKWTELR